MEELQVRLVLFGIIMKKPTEKQIRQRELWQALGYAKGFYGYLNCLERNIKVADTIWKDATIARINDLRQVLEQEVNFIKGKMHKL